jgi:thiamine phosphate synthase YjbQ (UPF0047 family)
MSIGIYQKELDIIVKDEKTFYKNITQNVQDVITQSDFQCGIALIHTIHTTTGLTNSRGEDNNAAPVGFLVQEDEPCLIKDLEYVLDFGAKKLLNFLPKITEGKRKRLLDFLPKDWTELLLEWTISLIKPLKGYWHDNFEIRSVNMGPNERKNAEAHIKAGMLRESTAWSFSRGRLNLGQWQSILFWDFDPVGRKKRKINVVLIGE